MNFAFHSSQCVTCNGTRCVRPPPCATHFLRYIITHGRVALRHFQRVSQVFLLLFRKLQTYHQRSYSAAIPIQKRRSHSRGQIGCINVWRTMRPRIPNVFLDAVMPRAAHSKAGLRKSSRIQLVSAIRSDSSAYFATVPEMHKLYSLSSPRRKTVRPIWSVLLELPPYKLKYAESLVQHFPWRTRPYRPLTLTSCFRRCHPIFMAPCVPNLQQHHQIYEMKNTFPSHFKLGCVKRFWSM